MNKIAPDKLDIIFGTNGPFVHELTSEEWFKIVNHAVRISEEHLKNTPAFEEISEFKKNDFLEIFKIDPYRGMRMLNHLINLLSDKALGKFAEIKDIFAVETEIAGIRAAIRENIKIIKNDH